MKTVNSLVAQLIIFGTVFTFGVMGFFIGAYVSPNHDIGALGHAILGAMIGIFVGFAVGIVLAGFIEKQPESNENRLPEPLPEPQEMWKKEFTNPDLERLRVEKYGLKIFVCSSCGAKNSTSYSRCLKCSSDLSKEQPIDNPYIVSKNT